MESTLPPDYRLLDELSRPSASARVLRVGHGTAERVLRIDSSADGAERRAELAVLAAVDHPGLARLLDHGTLPGGGGSFVARSWIAGHELSVWSKGRAPEDVGRVVARLCPALEHLHRRGFVHADLKAQNVIVSADGAPVLTDFGLARRSDQCADEVSGTLFGIAPEVLLGGAADARSDLFALGVLLHELLIGRRPAASEFYGRFPAEDFFAATDTSPADLPDWARDVVSALLERDPDRRVASAEQLGRTLAGRLGIDDLFRSREARVGWPVRTARHGWIERWCDEALGGRSGGDAEWLRFPRGEEPRALLDELALVASLAGASVHRIDVRAELGGLGSDGALDRWARRTCEEHAGALLLAGLPSSAPWARRGVEALARTLRQDRERGARNTPALVIGSTEEAAATDALWRELEVPPLCVEDVLEHLTSELEGDQESLERLARRLCEDSGGSATRLGELLEDGSRAGWFVVGENRARLRPGRLPARAREAGPTTAVDAGAARLFAALHVLGGNASLAETGALAELDGVELAAAIDELRSKRLVRVLQHGSETRLERVPLELEQLEGLPSEEDWRALHARRARALEERSAPEPELLPHRWRAGAAGSDEVLAASEELLDRGCPELALELLDAVADQSRESGRALESPLRAARALVWCALGQPDRALAEIEGLEETSPVARVRASIAALEHDTAGALENLERAVALDPRASGEALLAQARLLYELGRDDELLALAARLRATGEPPAGLRVRAWANLRAIEAMSLFRKGQPDRARAALAEQLGEAAGDPGREAGLCINLATIERRSGDPARAARYLERAIEHYDHAGRLPGLSQARAMLGGLRRDLGQLEQAERLLGSARALRERQGDRVGAAAVQGMLGLALADRGHARAAVQELEHSADALQQHGRSRDAILLEVRAREVRARLGSAATRAVGTESDRLGEGDPRVLISLARTAWLTGEESRARDLAQRALNLAGSLRLGGVRTEAAFVLRRLDDEVPESSDEGSLVADDARVLAMLATAPFDVEAAMALADRLEHDGRDDRAARLLLACVARVPDTKQGDELAERAERVFARCASGLSPIESAALRRSLLGTPDPWPEDLLAVDRRKSTEEEDEMEVIRLLEINHRLVTQEDLPTLLGAIVEQALAVSGAQRGFLILEEDGELAVDTALDSRRGGIEAPDVEVSGSVLRRALEGMHPIRISNAVDDPLLSSAPSVVNLELRSILCVPFEVQRNLRGVIYVDHRLREAAFDERVERLLALLADQAALAIQQVRRLQRIRELNRELEKRVVQQESDLATARARLHVAGLPGPAGGLVGDSPPMREIHKLLERAATTTLPVLVVGDSGTGKELAARALHDLGPRRAAPFVSENCAAIPASLIESELFGARRGAFTGADRDREGLFERAHGGTLFLDEIGELPIELQAKLLRVLEMGQVRRVGDTVLRDVDFRLVAATNRDLQLEIQEQRFRADLYYRLDGLSIRMPALRDHTEDIPALVEHCLRIRANPGEPPRTISKAVLARLCRREWPGNVRELFNEVSRLCVLSEGELDDPDAVRLPRLAGPGPLRDGAVRTMASIERDAIESALRATGGDKREAAERLGISRAKIYQRIKEWAASDADG